MPPKFAYKNHKQKSKTRAQRHGDNVGDSNAVEIIPTVHEKRKAELRAELRAQQPAATISSKKAKRLDHYIETKLRKEDNLELIKKLAAQKVDTSLFRSAKNLGRRGDTQREVLQRAVNETEHGINTSGNAAILFEERSVADADTNAYQPVVEVTSAVPFFGSGLKRPLQVREDGRPEIKKRKRRRVTVATSLLAKPAPEVLHEESDQSGDVEWRGFSADDDDDPNERDEEKSETGESESDQSAVESGSEDDESSSVSSAPDAEKRSSVFKLWAEQQRNEALGFTPSSESNTQIQQTAAQHVSRPKDIRPAVSAPALGPIKPSADSPALSVTIRRSDEIQASRLNLPVVQEEQKIMETIHNNSITIVCGATGSGKTTQVPQMMYESGYGCHIGTDKTSPDRRARGMIGVTQPRRVAATSVAQRVAVEMGDMKNRVGHQIRFDSAVGPSTAIKFMTDGILMREVASDFPLSRYSAIIIDEAHERSTNTDILIGLLSRIVTLRADLAKEKPDQFCPLKLVIMSATMRVEDFTHNTTLFKEGPPPIVQAEGRQYPVSNHFARETKREYLDEMFKKVSRGHRKLPKGGMLVFLTGQAEIQALQKRLEQSLASTPASTAEGRETDTRHHQGISQKGRHGYTDEEDELHGLSDEESDDEKEFDIEGDESINEAQKIHVLPLYSQLPANQQARVFKPPPEGSRLIVLSTNVAETSLTIPGVRYVFDCGRALEKRYDIRTGVQTFEISWISKASAAQRAGRAGRTGPGHCYRLYSSAVYERDFSEYSVPEILRSPVESVALFVKGVDFPNVAAFPFPTPPDRLALAKAEDLLRYLGAIDQAGKITQVGRTLANYPVSPRFGRMLLLAADHGVLSHTIALVSALAIPEFLIPQSHVTSLKRHSIVDDEHTSDSDDARDRRNGESATSIDADDKLKAHKKARAELSRWDSRSDALTLLTAFAICTGDSVSRSETCAKFFIREKGMSEAHKLRSQVVCIVQAQRPEFSETDLLSIPVLDDDQRAKLRYIVAAGYADQVAIRADLLPSAPSTTGRSKPRFPTDVPYRTLLPSIEAGGSGSDAEDKNVYVHPSSVLAKLTVAGMPPFVIYSHLSRAAAKTISDSSSSSGTSGTRTRMHPLTTVSARQLAALTDGTPLLEVGKPIGKITALGPDVKTGRERREIWVGLSLRGSGEGPRWDLGTRKERQVRTRTGWATESIVG